jgi:ribosomal protein L9
VRAWLSAAHAGSLFESFQQFTARYDMKDDQQESELEQEQEQDRNDNETILMALDQISQTIDVMTSVVGRLRHFVQEQEVTEDREVSEAMRPGRTLH